MANAFSQVKDLTVGQLAALVQRIGGSDAAEEVLRDNLLADKIAELIVGAKSAVDKFIVADHFKVDISDNPEVNISFIGDNFQEWFLGKVEEPAETTRPKFHHDLTKNSLDEVILADIGGEDVAEVTMAGIYELMKRQPKGEAGGLFMNGHGNIFYVKDVEGVLRAVVMHWDGGGWYVRAFRVDVEFGWFAGAASSLADS